jgi:hypothetical protein
LLSFNSLKFADLKALAAFDALFLVDDVHFLFFSGYRFNRAYPKARSAAGTFSYNLIPK